ncbi:hypothetical protein CEUSTIGMA_g4117.t1 [Chlamydomonas eustigma]|uniref:VASt domain-containing protein n=1 Tax=Chlamydomonas eustigma TaxID=1157962 RepID=A0A250X0R4_9CHLO|nr:hypothetical protein CEUSTIGMA_g4117.t1 [Chlamydomonas eustigma]|eukprot:GAX76671.1 hypothetical protein CEUSTIGMA_g4117.t1 [Chlamydomonas eustigma]
MAQEDQSPDCFPMPAPLPILVSEVIVFGSPESVFELSFSSESEFRAKLINEIDKLKDVVTSAWVPYLEQRQVLHDSALVGSHYGDIKTREMSYIIPLWIPLPGAPNQCQANETHWMVCRGGGFIIEKKATSKAPFADCFYTLVRITGVPAGEHATRLNISFKLEFVKEPSFLFKIAIENGAVNGTKKAHIQYVESLVATLGSPGAGDKGKTVDST